MGFPVLVKGDGGWEAAKKHGDRLTICPRCGTENRIASNQVREKTEVICGGCPHSYIVHPR